MSDFELHDDNNRDSVKVVCDSRDDGEIESNVTANSLHSEQEQNSREKPLDFKYSCDYAEDEREFSYINKKPRTKKSRKENRNKTFQVLRRGVGKRSPVVYLEDSRERKRRCTHCQAEYTPQWRLGPLGPNTLCNARGLRFKIGRLVANYRPAANPSFDSAKHSNFYKRLMRSKQQIKVQNDK